MAGSTKTLWSCCRCGDSGFSPHITECSNWDCQHKRCGHCMVCSSRGSGGGHSYRSAPVWESNVSTRPPQNASNPFAEQRFMGSVRRAEAAGSSIASRWQRARFSTMGTQPDGPKIEQTEVPSASSFSSAASAVVPPTEEKSDMGTAQKEAGWEDSDDKMASNSVQGALDTLLTTTKPEGTTEEISFQSICMPPEPVPCIDSRSGSRISEIRKASGARIGIDKPAFGDTEGYLLTASGSDAANEAALKPTSEESKAEDTKHPFASPTKDPLSVSEIMTPGSSMASTDSEGRKETEVPKSAMSKPELESESGAQTSTANLLPATANSMALATPPKRKPPIKFKDALGRNFNFPFELCQTWKGMNDLICQAFAHVEPLNAMVTDGNFDLVGPNGEFILPQTWDNFVEPGWRVAMHMWPIKKQGEKVHIDMTNTRPVPTAAPVPKRPVPPKIPSRRSGSSFGRSKSVLKPKDILFFTKNGVEEEPLLLGDTNKEDLPKAAEKVDDDNSSIASSSTLDLSTVNDSDVATDDKASPFIPQPPQQPHIEGPASLRPRIPPILIEDKGGPSGIDISAKSGIRHRPAASGGSGGRAPRQTPGEDRDIEQGQPHSPARPLSRGLTASPKGGRGRRDPDDSSPSPEPVSARLRPKRSHPCLGLATFLCLILGIISFAILGIAFKDAYTLEHYTLERTPRSSASCSYSSPSLSDPSFYFALQESGWLTVGVVSALIPACKHAYKYQKWFRMCYVWIPAAISLGLGMASPLTYVRSPAVSNGLAGMAGAMQAMVIYYATYEVFIEERTEDMAAIELRRRRRARRND